VSVGNVRSRPLGDPKFNTSQLAQKKNKLALYSGSYGKVVYTQLLQNVPNMTNIHGNATEL